MDEKELRKVIREEVERRLKERGEISDSSGGEVDDRPVSGEKQGGISRREFLKKAGLGAAGLGALSLSPVSALDIRDDDLSVYTESTGSDLSFEVDNSGNVTVPGVLSVLGGVDFSGYAVPFLRGSPPGSPVEGDIWIPTDSYTLGDAQPSQIWKYTGHSGTVYDVAVGPDNNYVYTGSADNEVHQISVGDGNQGWTYTGDSNVRGVAVSPDNDYVYSVFDDGDVHQVSVSDGSQGWIFSGNSNNVRDIAVGPDNNYVYSSSDGHIYQINISDGSGGWTNTDNYIVGGIAVHPNGDYVYCGTWDGGTHQINVSDGSGGWAYTGHDESVHDVDVGPDGDYVYSASEDPEIKQLSTSDGSGGWTYTGLSRWPNAVTVGPDNNYVYTGGNDSEVHEINISDGSGSWIYNGHNDRIKGLATGQDNNVNNVYSASLDSELHKVYTGRVYTENEPLIWNGSDWERQSKLELRTSDLDDSSGRMWLRTDV